MSAGSDHYTAYKTATEKHNTAPEVISGFEAVFTWRKDNGLDLGKADSHSTKFWDRGTVHHMEDGRVVEYSQTNSAVGTPLLAVFGSADAYLNYRKAMPLNFYLNH